MKYIVEMRTHYFPRWRVDGDGIWQTIPETFLANSETEAIELAKEEMYDRYCPGEDFEESTSFWSFRAKRAKIIFE